MLKSPPAELSNLSRVTGTRGRSFGTVCLDGQDGGWEAVCRLDLVCYDSESQTDCQMTIWVSAVETWQGGRP